MRRRQNGYTSLGGRPRNEQTNEGMDDLLEEPEVRYAFVEVRRLVLVLLSLVVVKVERS